MCVSTIDDERDEKTKWHMFKSRTLTPANLDIGQWVPILHQRQHVPAAMTGASFENVRRMLNELSTAADPGLVVLIAEVRRGPDRLDGSIVREFLAREPDFRSIFTAWLMLNDAHRYADVCTR